LTTPDPESAAEASGTFHVTPAERRVVRALFATPEGATYVAAAQQLGVSIGTVYSHLRRLRRREPELYNALMAMRREQLSVRHERAVRRAIARSAEWHGRQSARRYFRRFGVWPREAKFYRQIGRLEFLDALRRSRGY
jgi:DNA-binding CsgD family transcriptional regulator